MTDLINLCVKIYEMSFYNTMTTDEIATYLNIPEELVQDAVSTM